MMKYISILLIAAGSLAVSFFIPTHISEKNRKDRCADIAEMDIKDEWYDGTSKWDYWDYEDLSIPLYLNHITFLCDGSPVSGEVFEYDEKGEVVTKGYLENGKVTGEWSFVRGIDSGAIQYRLQDGEIILLDYKQFFRGALVKHCVLQDSINYVDTLFRLTPSYGISAISWGQGYGRGNFSERKKMLVFNDDGDLKSVQIADSVFINWLDDINEVRANNLARGFLVDIVKGKAERCYKYEPQDSPILYVGRDYNGNYYRHGLFVHFDLYGKPDSVNINLDPNLYR